jgi:glycosyltransferase involved in cell wall biosynthesis
MKVAVVGPAYPYRGGIAHYTALLAAHLSRAHDTQLYSFRQQYPVWLFPGRSQIDPSSASLVDINARRWLIPWWPISWWRVVRDWNAWQPDRIVMQWWVPFMAPMTAWLVHQARRRKIQVTLICHNVLPHERSRVDMALVRMALCQADRLIVHTTAERDRARALLPKAVIEVVPLPTYVGFESDRWTRDTARAALNIDGRVLLFFGLVRPYKGLIDLIDALPGVLHEIDVKLLVVGEIWGDGDRYRSRVNELNLQSHVRFVDRYVSNDEAAMYFAATDLVVLPYREATGSAVVQLAFGLGVPVVATRAGGMGDVVEDGVTGYLVEPQDVEGLSAAIVRFFREDRSAEFRAAIERGRSRFSWDRLIAAIERRTG